METIVLKFGGTSVGSTDRITAVANLIKSATEEASPVVVVSAHGPGSTRHAALMLSFAAPRIRSPQHSAAVESIVSLQPRF